MILLLLILIPFLAGIGCFLWKNNSVKTWTLIASLIALAVAIFACVNPENPSLSYDHSWINSLGARFTLQADSMALVLALLTAIVYPLIFIAHWNQKFEDLPRFLGLLLLSQAGITGVFLADDLLLFYFFWELALIPIYFLASTWGGKKRIKITFKFFTYTFFGSLMMLAGIIYLYLHTTDSSFAFNSIVEAGKSLDFTQQQILFWFIFIAFAIKMPLFPFHTWQPDLYEESAIPVTIVLSAVMVKMGLFATAKWLLPTLPLGVEFWSNTVMILCVVGIIYGSILAIVQTDLKRLVAYASIAHIGLICLGLFSQTEIALHGAIIQMFNHGVNITGLWLLVGMIEKRYKTRNLGELGGMAGSAPFLTIALVIIVFANIALPLTNGFVGEFMLFYGIFESANPYHIWYMALAGTGIIFGAVYLLNFVQKTAYGFNKSEAPIVDAQLNEKIGLIVIIMLILVVGIYPNLIFGMLV